MTERELLEAAAKAAGDIPVPLVWIRPFDDELTPINNRGEPWNPLTDDGDALKLADQLQLTIKFDCGLVLIGTNKKLLADEASEDYKYAIVRAAAAIATHKEQL